MTAVSSGPVRSVQGGCGASSERCDFSVVIPTYNRPSSLRGCLRALSELDYPRERFEVVIVDDGSEAPLDEVIAPFASGEQTAGLRIRYLRQVNAGPAKARNAGIRAASGRYVALTDDDCAPEPGWLRQLMDCFEKVPDDAVAGRTVNGLTQNAYAAASQLLIDFLMDYFNREGSDRPFATTSNLAFPREALVAMGGFDETFPVAAAEDRELVDRWFRRGQRLSFVPGARVVHFHRMNLAGFLRQHANYGRGACRFHRIRQRAGHNAPGLESASFYLAMLRFPRRRDVGPLSEWRIKALLVASQCANVWGFLAEKWRAPR